MRVLQKPEISHSDQCPYLSDRQARFEYFFADSVTASELDILLNKGWRKFGYYYFRPACENCKACIPIRVCVNSFKPSKSQRRLLKKNSDVKITFHNELEDIDDVYEIFKDHSLTRFGKETDFLEFIHNFKIQSCPTIFSKYYIDNKLGAVGFIDHSVNGLSSVYFIYSSQHCKRGLGNFSILQEIEYTRALHLEYYYLGYYVEGNDHMMYKGHFYPHERLDWGSYRWNISE